VLLLRLVQAEIGLWRTLWWAARGKVGIGPDTTPVRYADRFGVVLWGLSAVGLVELLVVHLLIPWPVARWVLFVLGVYALVWFVAFALSLRQHPHLLRENEMVLRFGHFRSVRIPIDGLAGVRAGAVSGHKRTVVLGDGRLVLSVMGDTNVELRFDPGVDVEVQERTHTVQRVAFWADDPRTTTAFLRDRGSVSG
jgi:hypothetical protein